MTDSPSALLERAAERLEELAAVATAGPWGWSDNGDSAAFGQVRDGTPRRAIAVIWEEPKADAAWIATMSPAVAHPLVEWLRYAGAQYEVAERRVRMHHARDVENWVSGSDRAALAFARQVLGESP